MIMYIDDINLLAKNKKRTRNSYLRMEFGIEKCAMLIMKKGSGARTNRKVPKQENIRTLGEKENYKYLEIFEAYTIKYFGFGWFLC